MRVCVVSPGAIGAQPTVGDGRAWRWRGALTSTGVTARTLRADIDRRDGAHTDGASGARGNATAH